MWPVQTLTLLLCLTDDEQLYAQSLPPVPECPAIEVPAVEAPIEVESSLLVEVFA